MGTGSRRAVAPRGWRPAGRRAAFCVLAALVGLIGAAGCERARHAAALTAALERSFPGGGIAIAETVEGGARTVEVSIAALELPADAAELGERARAVARLTRGHLDLGAGDTVVVVLRSDEGAGGIVRSRQRARFVVPVEELGGR